MNPLRSPALPAVLFGLGLTSAGALARPDVQPPVSAPQGILSAAQINEFGFTVAAVASRDLPGYRRLHNVLVTAGSSSELVSRLRAAAPGVNFVAIPRSATKNIPPGGFDAAFVSCSDTGALAATKNTAWIHAFSSGVEHCLANPTVHRRRPIVTNSRGAGAVPIAEHAIALMFAHAKRLALHYNNQARRDWGRDSFERDEVWEIDGKTMLVLGLGAIGKEVARRADALGMRVVATRASSREGPDYVDYVGLADETLKLAAEADVIVNALPLTPKTSGLIDAGFFRAMKNDALIVSVGRGHTIVTNDLLAALNTGEIGGAALDVTEPEPLPGDHPLWRAPNVIITPHVAGAGGNSREKVYRLLLENLRRYQAGEPLLNMVDVDAGY